jgi:hypothetical protein
MDWRRFARDASDGSRDRRSRVGFGRAASLKAAMKLSDKQEQFLATAIKILLVVGQVYSLVTSLARADVGRFDEATYRLLWAIIFWFFWYQMVKVKPPKEP